MLAWDEALAAGGYYTVTAVWAHEDPVTVLLTVDGETIETTPEHPFLTADGSWVTAGKLAVGDTLRSAHGDVGVVEEITFVAAPQVMYNMIVAVVHTYVVGDGEWVVHNHCGLAHSKILRANIEAYTGLSIPAGVAAHHVIPNQHATHAFVEFAAQAGWDNDE